MLCGPGALAAGGEFLCGWPALVVGMDVQVRFPLLPGVC